MMPNRKQRRAGKPHGMTYADVLAQKQHLRTAVDKAARDTTVQLRADTHTQRAMWLMVISIHDAFGIGAERMQKLFDAMQENSDWIERNTWEVDADYAYEKLRKRAEDVTGIQIEYLYEKDAVAAQLRTAMEATE